MVILNIDPNIVVGIIGTVFGFVVGKKYIILFLYIYFIYIFLVYFSPIRLRVK